MGLDTRINIIIIIKARPIAAATVKRFREAAGID